MTARRCSPACPKSRAAILFLSCGSMVGDAPLRRFALFPGVPLDVADVDAVLAEYGEEPEE